MRRWWMWIAIPFAIVALALGALLLYPEPAPPVFDFLKGKQPLYMKPALKRQFKGYEVYTFKVDYERFEKTVRAEMAAKGYREAPRASQPYDLSFAKTRPRSLVPVPGSAWITVNRDTRGVVNYSPPGGVDWIQDKGWVIVGVILQQGEPSLIERWRALFGL